MRFVNVGNKDVKLNLVPVDFVVEGIAALAKDEKAKGKTIALADPNPLTTGQLFEAIVEALTGKKSVITPPPPWSKNRLMLPISPALTGLPHSGVPYFFLTQTYDTSVAERASRRARRHLSEFFVLRKKSARICRKKSDVL